MLDKHRKLHGRGLSLMLPVLDEHSCKEPERKISFTYGWTRSDGKKSLFIQSNTLKVPLHMQDISGRNLANALKMSFSMPAPNHEDSAVRVC